MRLKTQPAMRTRPVRKSPPRSSLLWFIEAFSAFSAIAFVVSAVGNAIIFWQAWRLNYFMIASPSDVIMSGFIVGTATAVLMVAYTWASVFPAILAALVRRRGWRHMWAAVRNARLPVVGFLASFPVLLAAPIVYAMASVTPFPSRDHGIMLFIGFHYHTGLRLAPESNVPETCEGGPVLWLGSQAAIIFCEPNVRVIHNVSDLVTERFDPEQVIKEHRDRKSREKAPAEQAPPCRNGLPECDPWEREWKAGETPTKGSVVARDGAITPPKPPSL